AKGDEWIEQAIQESSPFIDFEYRVVNEPILKDMETLAQWYARAHLQGTFTPHPLTAGGILKLTVDSADHVAMTITQSSEKEFRVYGPVGSGKSTRLPGCLSASGPVLILVPSRDLAENLYKSIQHVCEKEPSLCMMNVRRAGCSNITVMTYGYALLFFNANKSKIHEYKFVQMDECHEFQAHMIAFYAWWLRYGGHTRLVKTTATPIGTVINPLTKKVDTNFPVKIVQVHSKGVEEFADLCLKNSADTIPTLLPNGGRVIIFVPSRNDCERMRVKLVGLTGSKNWVVNRTHNVGNRELVEQLQQDSSKYQIIITTSVLQNGVNLDPDLVIDFGFTFESVYDGDQRAVLVRKRAINPSELIQRVGRTGRNKPGIFLQVGKRLEVEAPPNSVVVTDAVMLTHILDLHPYTHNNLVDEVGFVTREQVDTASKFSLPLMFMIHYVCKDGRMLRGYYHAFKGLLLHTAEVQLVDSLSGDCRTNNFYTLRSYQQAGVITHESVLPSQRIPFYTHELALPFYLEIARITEEALQPSNFRLVIPSHNIAQAVLRLATSRKDVPQSIMFIQQRVNMVKEQIERFETMRASSSRLSTMSMCTSLFNDKSIGVIKQLRTVATLGQELISSLQEASATHDDAALHRLVSNNPLLGDFITYQ
nr:CI [Caladenia virus A]